MCNVLKPERQKEVLHMLVEGASIRSTERLTGVHRDTVTRLMLRFGEGCRQLLDERLRSLTLGHLELDETWTFVLKKQGRLTADERQERSDIGEMYLWTAVDQRTKLVPAFLVGKRSADNARRFLLDVASRLVFPSPHDSDPHAYQPGGYQVIVQLSSDAFKGYPEAVDLAFGAYAKYGIIKKDYRNATQPGRYAPPEMVGTERRRVYAMREDEERTICTSHVERHNLTIRTLMRRFTRLALGFSKKLENLQAAVAGFMAYYNFCWRTRYPDWSGKRGKRRAPAALLAGVTDRLWTFDTLFDEVM
jgi:IS1 family transposase